MENSVYEELQKDFESMRWFFKSLLEMEWTKEEILEVVNIEIDELDKFVKRYKENE
jgi:hypothetical protein